VHILYLTPWFPYPLDTGSRTRVYYLLRGLAYDHDVTLLSLAPRGWEEPDIDSVAPFCKHCAVVQRDPFEQSAWRRSTRFFSSQPIVTQPFPEMLELVKTLNKKESFDVVIASGTVMADYALALSGIPRILEEHNSMSRWIHERYLVQSGTVRRLRYRLSWEKSTRYERKLFRKFDLVSMVSEEDAACARELMVGREDAVQVFPNGVDINQFSLVLAAVIEHRLIFSGSLAYPANLEAMRFFLDEVFPRIREQLPAAHLVITGSTENVDLKSLKLDNQVMLTGFVSDIQKEITQASVAIVPILSGGGTRIKILEAMALGTPVVATTKGAEGLDIDHGRNILLADDPEIFTKEVVRLLEDAPLRQRLVENARQLVEEEYDWNRIAQTFSQRVVSLVEKDFLVAS